MDNAALFSFLQQRLPSTLEWLKRMVDINSFSTNREGVNRLGRLTAEAFEEFGFRPEFVPSAMSGEYGEHLVLIRPGRTRRTIGLISHLDTVFPPEEEERNRFFWRPEGERIYGPGTEDIKGGTMMIHLTLSALRQFAPETFGDITWAVMLNSSEEVYSPDFAGVCLPRLGPECLAALVFESGIRRDKTFSIVTARKGRSQFRVTAEGRGAHAGSDHRRGINAITQLADTVRRIADLTDFDKALTFNIGAISGGSVVNRVPHRAVAEGEMRAFDPAVFQAGLASLKALENAPMLRSVNDGHPCRVRIEVDLQSPPWPCGDQTRRLLQCWREAGQTLGFAVQPEERGGLSDGNYLCHAVPVLDGLGPNGDNGHCSEHSEDGSKQQEYVDAASFVPKAALNTLAILKLARAAS